MSRVRATPTAALSASNLAATNTSLDCISQSKKRKRCNEEEMVGPNVDRLEKELVEHHSQRLKEQLNDFKRRLDKYERLDKMLSLWEEHKRS